jgi:hypothetical protein
MKYEVWTSYMGGEYHPALFVKTIGNLVPYTIHERKLFETKEKAEEVVKCMVSSPYLSHEIKES